MSAPPIAAVVVNPLMKLNSALVERNAAATIGADGAMVKNPAWPDRQIARHMKLKVRAIVSPLSPNKVLLTRCFPGSARGFDAIRPASLRNATIEPVKVIPPITTPS